MKNLQNKAIDIKGKKYVLVADRVVAFNEDFPQGSITCELLSPYDSDLIVIKATVRPSQDATRVFTGHSQAKVGDGYINKTSALENAETSAVGRALALMGIGVIDSIASVDEINKTTYYKPKETKNVEKFMDDLQPTDEEVAVGLEKLQSAQTLRELNLAWKSLVPMIQVQLEVKKNELKSKFQ